MEEDPIRNLFNQKVLLRLTCSHSCGHIVGQSTTESENCVLKISQFTFEFSVKIITCFKM